jgi:tetratricopeptide (TPR) repeat protein
MSLKLAGQSTPDRPSDLAASLSGTRVCCAGHLAAIDAEEFEALLDRHGAKPATLKDATLIVVGDADWPTAGAAAEPATAQLKTLEELERRAAAGARVIAETDFLRALGVSTPDPDQRQLFSTARLTELLGVSRERIRAWVRAGLIEPAKTEHGIWYFDFQQVSAARTLHDLTASGVSAERIRRALAKLKKFMPALEQPLQQLATLEKNGQMLVRLEAGDLAEADGQLHFEFTDDPAPSPMRIAPGPRTAVEWLEQGLEQEREGFLEEAAASYRQALLAGGPDPQTCLNLGNVLRSLGNKAQALERYAQAVEADPDFVDGWNNLGTLLVELDKPDDACVAFHKAIAADPNDPRTHYNLADTLDEMGRYQDALPHWQAYAQADPFSKWGTYARQRIKKTS